MNLYVLISIHALLLSSFCLCKQNIMTLNGEAFRMLPMNLNREFPYCPNNNILIWRSSNNPENSIICLEPALEEIEIKPNEVRSNRQEVQMVEEEGDINVNDAKQYIKSIEGQIGGEVYLEGKLLRRFKLKSKAFYCSYEKRDGETIFLDCGVDSGVVTKDLGRMSWIDKARLRPSIRTRFTRDTEMEELTAISTSVQRDVLNILMSVEQKQLNVSFPVESLLKASICSSCSKMPYKNCSMMTIRREINKDCYCVKSCAASFSTILEDGTCSLTKECNPYIVTLEGTMENFSSFTKNLKFPFKKEVVHDHGRICSVVLERNKRILLDETKPSCKNQVYKTKTITLLRLGDGIDFALSHKLNKAYHPKHIESYNCSDEDICSKGKCNGGEAYRMHFIGDTNSNIYCEMRTRIYSWQITTKSGLHNIKSWEFVKARIGYPVEKKESFSVVISCKKDGLYFISTGGKVRLISVIGSEFSFTKRVEPGLDGFIKIPLGFYLKGEDLRVVSYSNTQSSEVSVICPTEKMCSLVNCKFCLIKWATPACYEAFEWMIMSTLSIVVMVGVALLVIKIRFLYYKRRLTRNNQVELEDEGIPLRRVRRRNNIMRSKLYSLVILMIIIPNSTSENCNSVSSLIAESKDCQEGVENKCIFKREIRVNLAPEFSQACINFQRDGQETKIGTMILETSSLRHKCAKKVLYYVPKVLGHCNSYRECGSGSECGDENCAKFSNTTSFPYFKEGFDNMHSKKCFQTCGCAACGCFVCTAACNFAMGYLENPSRQFWEVFECPEWTTEAELKVKMLDGTSESVDTVTLSPGITKFLLDAEFTLITTNTPSSSLEYNCFMKDKEGISMTQCNRESQVIKGQIGEIQCPSEVSAEEASKLCHFSEDIIRLSATTYSSSCEFYLIDPEKVKTISKLPLMTQNGLFEEKFGTIIHTNKQSSSVQVAISFKDLKVWFSRSSEECTATATSLTGCYSCTAGANLTLKIESKGEVTGVISCPSMANEVLIRGGKGQTISTKVGFQQHTVSEVCSIQCGSHKSRFNVQGILQLIPVTFVDTKSEIVKGSETSGKMDLNFLWDYLSWWSMLIGLGTVLGLLLVLIMVKKLLRKKRK